MPQTSSKGHATRRPGLLIASALLACGAGLALSTPASAAPRDTSGHWCDNYDGNDYQWHHHYWHHGYHHGGLVIGVNIGIGIGIGG